MSWIDKLFGRRKKGDKTAPVIMPNIIEATAKGDLGTVESLLSQGADDDLPPLNRSRYNVVFGLKKRKGEFYGQEVLHA